MAAPMFQYFIKIAQAGQGGGGEPEIVRTLGYCAPSVPVLKLGKSRRNFVALVSKLTGCVSPELVVK